MQQTLLRITTGFTIVIVLLAFSGHASLNATDTSVAGDTPSCAKEEIQAEFDALWSDEIEQALRSRDTQARVALARRMIDAAGQMPSSPGVQRLTLEKAAELTSGFAEGIEVAFSAVDLIAKLNPDEATAMRARKIEILQNVVPRVRDLELRKQLAARLTALLIEHGRQYLASGNHERARQLFRMAAASNRVGQGVEDAVLAALIDSAEQMRRLDRTILQLRDRMESNPEDPAPRIELCVLLLVEKEDIDAARKVAEALDDEPIKLVLSIMVMEDQDAVTAEQWLTAARALLELSRSPRLTPVGQATLLNMSRDGYRAFLDRCKADSAEATHGRNALDDIERRLNRIDARPRRVGLRPSPITATLLVTNDEIWQSVVVYINGEIVATSNRPQFDRHGHRFSFVIEPRDVVTVRTHDRGNGFLAWILLDEQGTVLSYSKSGLPVHPSGGRISAFLRGGVADGSTARAMNREFQVDQLRRHPATPAKGPDDWDAIWLPDSHTGTIYARIWPFERGGGR